VQVIVLLILPAVDLLRVEGWKERKKAANETKRQAKFFSALFGNDQQFEIEPKHLVD
jgi:hypothetical protein